ncbi:MAG: hypothetical protein HZC37_08530 [Burkholderiales bacterium]|nr:hypothetical protein [Burkholderiales bacterium]
MGHRELHVMRAVLDEERQTMRYTCTACERCVEDGPDGLRILSRGDPEAVHQGGSLTALALELEPDLAPPPPMLH